MAISEYLSFSSTVFKIFFFLTVFLLLFFVLTSQNFSLFYKYTSSLLAEDLQEGKIVDDNLLIIANQIITFGHPNEVIRVIADISGDSIVNHFKEIIDNKSTEPTNNRQGVFIYPFHSEEYLDCVAQFDKEGIISFRGLICDKLVQIDFGNEFLLLFPSYNWEMFHLFPEIHRDIHKFFISFLSNAGCKELIYISDSFVIAEFINGIKNSSFQFSGMTENKGAVKINSHYRDSCIGSHPTFIDIKKQLQKLMGEPASCYEEIAYWHEHKYLIEKI